MISYEFDGKVVHRFEKHIHVIKAIRDISGLPLKEAKDMADKIAEAVFQTGYDTDRLTDAPAYDVVGMSAYDVRMSALERELAATAIQNAYYHHQFGPLLDRSVQTLLAKLR